MVDEVQFPRAGDAQNLAGKVSVQSPNCDGGVCRKVLEEDASVRQYGAMPKVFFAKLRSRLDQALAPETFLFAGFLQLNPIAQFPWDPGTRGRITLNHSVRNRLNHRSRFSKEDFIGVRFGW